MNPTLETYREHRNQLLAEIIASLTQDERFVAGWLTGSFGRNDEDSVSDIDLSLVAADRYSESLCMKLVQVSAQTSPERYALFSQFGTPALIHENNNNAPKGGTFTFVLYSEFASMVDWILIPQSKAIRPYQSHLLFDKACIPVSPSPKPEDIEENRKSVAENWAFFWMMTAITTKYIIRGDGAFVAQWIENLHSLIREIERKINGEPWSYTRGSLSQLQITRQMQIKSLKQLCRKMQELRPKVAQFTGSEPLIPLAEIEILFSLANQ